MLHFYPKFSSLLSTNNWHHRQPLTLSNFASHVLPALLSYYLTAIFVQIPGSLRLRIGLLPVTLILFWRATQISLERNDQNYNLRHVGDWLTAILIILSFRAIVWSFQVQPYKRCKNGRRPSETESTRNTLLWDALDLSFNFRGYDWNWSRIPDPPIDPRPIADRAAFLKVLVKQFVCDYLFVDQLFYLLQLLAPSIASTEQVSLFDPQYHSVLGRVHSTLICLVVTVIVGLSIQLWHNLGTAFGVGLCGQHPSQWPPIFDGPSRATSLTRFWGSGWHQLFRDIFLQLGGLPMNAIFGRVGGVIGAFFVSVLFHDLALRAAGRPSDFRGISILFLMSGVGVILETIWRKTTGYRVQGFRGWLWTMAWSLGWAHFSVDVWLGTGILYGLGLPFPLHPSMYTPPATFFHLVLGSSVDTTHRLLILASFAKLAVYIWLHPLRSKL